MVAKRICVLGAGDKPLTNFNSHEFMGLEGIRHYNAVNVDRRWLLTTDYLQDLSQKRWGFDDNEFDIVIAQHVIEHVPDRIAFIAECLRIVKPGGLIIIETPNYSHVSAHSNLEHLTTFSRVIFDDCYVNDFGKKWKVEKIYYRITDPIFWKSMYIKTGFVGRILDKFTGMISGLTFFIRAPK